MKNGKEIGYYPDGTILYEVWYKDGQLHRLDGPAYVNYYEDGTIRYVAWYKDDKKLEKIDIMVIDLQNIPDEMWEIDI